MKIVFWIVITADMMALFLFFILGLAAAGSSRTSPFAVTLYMLPVPALFILTSIFLFLRSASPALRGLAITLAALPWLALFYLRAAEDLKVRLSSDSKGNLTYFRAGTLRDTANAISRNDAATVASLAPHVSINSHGYSGMTLLMFALRQLRQTPQQIDCLRALLHAGADPNIGGNYEWPLETAIQLSPKSGPEPVALLLGAGADPNRKNTFGSPAYFAATGLPIDPGILKMLLDHGANLSAKDGNGLSVVFQGANNGNWKAVLLLLHRGAPWKNMRGANSLDLPETAESNLRVYGEREGLREVIAYLHEH